MTRSRRRRAPLVLLIAIGVLAAACGSGPAGGAGANQANCEHWCGHGTATVTIDGTTTKISGGGCYDQGSDGVDVRFGDWMDDGPIDYLSLTVYRAGGPTPPPADTQPPEETDPAAPTGLGPLPEPTGTPEYNVTGSVNGNPFILDVGASAALGSDGKGTYSGTDIDGAGQVSGTFSCH